MSSKPNLLRKFHQICFDKCVYISVHDGVHVRRLIICPVVLHAAVVEDVTAYLASPFDLLLACLHFRLRLSSLLELQLVELTPQVPQSILSILRLVACLGILDDDLVRLVSQGVDELIVQPHTGLHFVDVLSAGTTNTLAKLVMRFPCAL